MPALLHTNHIFPRRMGHVEVVQSLFSRGGDPTVTNSQGNNALDVALEARNLLGRPEVAPNIAKPYIS